jgi:alkylhydroperoxidase family enzyme
MPRIPPLEREETSGKARTAFDRELARFGRLTNMKRTLMRSPPAYHALMEWYPLFNAISHFLGERLAIVFAHAISSESDCLICATFMRRLLMKKGENPNALDLDEKDKAVVEFGRAIVRPGNRVPDAIYRKIETLFNPEQIVALTAFASLMVATNMINNILEVELDEYLYEYREAGRNPNSEIRSPNPI